MEDCNMEFENSGQHLLHRIFSYSNTDKTFEANAEDKEFIGKFCPHIQD